MANRRFVQRAVRRPTFWEGNSVTHINTSGTTVFSTLVSEASLENTPNSTLIRLRGEVLVVLNTIGSVPAKGVFTMGIKFTTGAALAGASVEAPLTDIGSDWIWWNTMGLELESGTLENAQQGIAVVKRVEIDSKAMRKVGLNRVLVFVTQHTAILSTMTVDLNGAVRALFKR